ncbi:MAG TPA: 3-phosphoshikimate 1-carboxyvinyltransferase [Pyrinomonadaceae bacterium]|jgi:3-phosphoshikimate 1-carboxyvinyltransferase
MKIRPAKKVLGEVSLPGDKSISHRAAIIAALSNGTSQLTNFATGQDCASTLSCLRELGVHIEHRNSQIMITGVGLQGFRPPNGALDCGNSGSTMRMLAGVLAGQSIKSTLVGDASLSNRPMLRVIEPLERMGAHISATDGRPPLTIDGTRDLHAIQYKPPVASAQVKSCVLFAGLQAKGRTVVCERQATRDHTERLLNAFGVSVETKQSDHGAIEIAVDGKQMPVAKTMQIPGDISSAAFFIAAAGLLAESNLEIAGVGLNPTRTEFLSVCRLLGFDIEVTVDHEECNEPLGRILIRGKRHHQSDESDVSNSLRDSSIPQLIDELPLLAVIASQVPGGLSIRGAKELRYKESDRIASTVKNLQAMGAKVEEFPDGLTIAGPQALHGSRLQSFGDHRIAMAFTVAALLADGESELEGSESVSISFPEFFTLLESLLVRS